MPALDDFASDVHSIIADLNAQFSVLNDTKLKLKQQGGELAQNWAVYFQKQKEAMAAAQNALNQISNVPLSETSTKVSAVGGPLSSIPTKAAANGSG